MTESATFCLGHSNIGQPFVRNDNNDASIGHSFITTIVHKTENKGKAAQKPVSEQKQQKADGHFRLVEHQMKWPVPQAETSEITADQVDIEDTSSLADNFDQQLVFTPTFSPSENKPTVQYIGRPKTKANGTAKENLGRDVVGNINFTEAREIWGDIDRIVKRSEYGNRKCTPQSSCSTDTDGETVNSIEFMKCFEKEKEKILSEEVPFWSSDGYAYIKLPLNMLDVSSLGSQGETTGYSGQAHLAGNDRSKGTNLRSNTMHQNGEISTSKTARGSNKNGYQSIDNGFCCYDNRQASDDQFGQLRHSAPGRICVDGPVGGKPLRLITEQNGQGSSLGVWKGNAGKMTTTLPRITPMSTSAMSAPLPTGITQPPPRSHSSASMYVPYPPKDLSSSMDFIKIPGRVNPLAPPPPRRRINWTWETTDQHYENEKRRLLMQKREHTRYHSAWGKAFYGAPAEKEAYRRHFRETLKQQMDDKDSMHKQEMKSKVQESDQAINYDRECRMNDSQEFFRKHNYLMQYRDTNKQYMENKWAEGRHNKRTENRIDQERLRYNPINWSCTLK